MGDYPCYLDNKEYDVWYLNDDNPFEVAIYDEANTIFQKDNIKSSSSISVGGDTYNKIGSFNCEQEGEYWVYAENSCVLYITEGKTVNFSDICFVSIAFFGIAFIGNGIHLWNKERKEVSFVFDQINQQQPQQYDHLSQTEYGHHVVKKNNVQKGIRKVTTGEKMIIKVKTCPKCAGQIPITSMERPLKVTCPGCSMSFMYRGTEEKTVGDESGDSPTTVGVARKVPVKKVPVFGTKTCPKCQSKISVTSKERPWKVICQECSTSFLLKK